VDKCWNEMVGVCAFGLAKDKWRPNGRIIRARVYEEMNKGCLLLPNDIERKTYALGRKKFTLHSYNTKSDLL